MVIHLNGTSSSGKTSIAKELQGMLSGYPLNFSIDSVLYALPPVALENMTSGKGNPGLSYSSLEEGYYRCARVLGELGHVLILDNAVTTEASYERLTRNLGDLKLIRIGVWCELAELERREIARGDRTLGEARAQFDHVHRVCPSHLTVNSTQSSPRALAMEICLFLRRSESGNLGDR